CRRPGRRAARRRSRSNQKSALAQAPPSARREQGKKAFSWLKQVTGQSYETLRLSQGFTQVDALGERRLQLGGARGSRHFFLMPRFVLALDQGTTSSRALIFDRQGRPRGLARQEFAQHFPRPGWVEHDPGDLWSTVRRTAELALRRARLTRRDLAAVGLTNQRETTLLWERSSGRPIAPAIVWQDRRTAPMCAELKRKKLEPLFRRRTGLL